MCRSWPIHTPSAARRLMTIRIAIKLTIEIPAPSTGANVAKDLEDIDKVKTKSGIEIPVQNSTVIQGG